MMDNNAIRLGLSQAYRILAHWGVDDHTYTHVSARSAQGDSFFIYPFGTLFHEVKPQNLIEVPLKNCPLNPPQVNQTGNTIHSAVYCARPDIQWIIHIHTPEIVAVSSCKEGLLPLSQWALHFYNRIAYHDYHSLALHGYEGEKIAQDMGPHFTMLMRNHGSVTCGRTVQEAIFYTHHLQQACKTQCLALAMNQKLVIPPHDMCERAVHDLLSFEENLGERDWNAWLRYL